MMDFCSLRTFDEWRGDDNSSDVEEAEKPWHGVIVMACRRTAAAVRSIRDRIMVNVGSLDDERVRVVRSRTGSLLQMGGGRHQVFFGDQKVQSIRRPNTINSCLM